MNRVPKARKQGGYFIFAPTEDAKRVRKANEGKEKVCALPEKVHADAERAAKEHGIRDPDLFTVRGFYELQTGAYFGQTFHWLMENAMGWAVWLITDMENTGGNTGESPLHKHKQALKVSAVEYY